MCLISFHFMRILLCAKKSVGSYLQITNISSINRISSQKFQGKTLNWRNLNKKMAFIGYVSCGNNYDCEIEFDGASKGNPGMSGAGAILRDRRNNTTWHLSKGLGVTTCNVAEYHGLILGMRAALEKGYRRVHVSGDSSLVCNQVDGSWRVSNPNLKILHEEVQVLRSRFVLFTINRVPRENNGDADYEANTGCYLPNGCVNTRRV